MNEVVTVKLWGTVIGKLGYAPNQTQVATFEYNPDFIKMGVEVSPLKVSIKTNKYTFDDISQRTFHGLPGFIADALPDKFGNQLIDQYFAQKGINSEDITALDRLLYVGNRAMGAIEYEPCEKFDLKNKSQLNLDDLSQLAEIILTKKQEFSKKLKDSNNDAALSLLRIGSSAGGARSKALVAIDKEGKLYDGTVNHNFDCEYYLLKFDSTANSDRDNKDPKGMTKVEYIYSLIAKKCNINIPDTSYIESNNDFHFLIKRFDKIKLSKNRIDKLHYVSWSGLAHAHRDETGAYSYEQLILTARNLGLGQDSITELFKRAVFNIIGRNQDDHTKNFGFLMGRDAKWKLSPAFDLTYSYDPKGKWTRVHQIRLNNRQDEFNIDDLIEFGKYCNINEKKVREITKSTIEAFKNFESYADQYKVNEKLKNTILSNLRVDIF